MSCPVECEPHEVCEAHRFPRFQLGPGTCRRPGSSVTLQEGPGRRRARPGGWSVSPQVAPTRGPGPGTWQPRLRGGLGFVHPARQEFQEMRSAPVDGEGRGRGLRRGGGGGGGARTAGAGLGPVKRSVAGRGHCGPPEKRTGHRPIGDHRSSFGRASSAGAHAWHHGPDASFRQAQSERGRGLGFRGPAPGLAGGLGGVHCPGSKWGSCRRVLPSAQVLARLQDG